MSFSDHKRHLAEPKKVDFLTKLWSRDGKKYGFPQLGEALEKFRGLQANFWGLESALEIDGQSGTAQHDMISDDAAYATNNVVYYGMAWTGIP